RCSAASITKMAHMPDTSCTSPMPCRIATISKCFAKTWLSRKAAITLKICFSMPRRGKP
ncbi:hypothetical protein, partial [Escherichia coli]|uniref:hypothetical protein n=1 Tax=Escherichia coli TaxID=562 RepID=UPI00338F2A2B